MKTRLLCIYAFLLLHAIATAAPLYIYTGDGITVVVLTSNEDGTRLSGELRLDKAVHPFTATVRETEDEEEIVDGSFTADGKARKFRASLDDDEEVTLVMDGKTYRLTEVDELPVAPPPPPERPAMEEKDKPAASTITAAGPVRLKKVTFNDVTMGVPACTMLVPHDWTAEGRIEWPPVDNPFPQPTIRIVGPGNEKITYVPAMSLGYAESRDGSLPPKGTPAPENLGQWLVGYLQQNNKAVSQVRLIDSRRLPQIEEHLRKTRESVGGITTPGSQEEYRLITIGYVEKGIPMREEINVYYVRMPFNTAYVRSESWNLYFNACVAAAEKSFAQLRPQLYAYADSYAELPLWWTRKMEVRQQIINLRTARINEEIRRRGQMISEMSDRQHATYMANSKREDEAQRQRIQGIYEVQDYRDSDGSRVELPFHYKHVFSDGQGNYVLSNTYEKPGEAFQEIQAAK